MEETDDGKNSSAQPGENETNYTDSVRSKDELESVIVDHLLHQGSYYYTIIMDQSINLF